MTASLGRCLGLLGETDFRRLWLAQSVSQLGTQVTALALPLVAILVIKASAFEVAVLGAVEFLPFLFFTLPVGAWVDRLPRKRVLVSADLGRALVLGFVPLASIAGALAMWQLYIVAFAAGTLTVFFDVAYQAILPELVERDRLAEGNSRLEISRSAAQVLGPGIGGLLVGLLTAPVAILVDAASYLGSAGFLVGMHGGTPAGDPTRGVGPRGAQSDSHGIRGEVADGLRFYRNGYLRATSAAVVTINLASQIGVGPILLVYVVRELGLTPTVIGLVFSISSVGLLVGAILAQAVGRRLGIGRALIGALAVSAGGTFLIVAATRDTAVPFLITAGLLQGFAGVVFNVNAVSLRQAITPDALQGRVNATGKWLNYSAIPLGAVVAGVLATAVGLRGTILIGAILGLLAVPWLIFSPIRSLITMPSLADLMPDADPMAGPGSSDIAAR